MDQLKEGMEKFQGQMKKIGDDMVSLDEKIREGFTGVKDELGSMISGISALCSPLLLDWVTSFYLSLSIPQMPLWVLSCIRYSLSILVLLVPTTLMGESLPVLSRFFIRTETELEKKIGSLYALNTIGGVLGTFLVGFILIRFLGISMTLKVTAFLSICIGAVSYMLGAKELMQEEQSPAEGCAVVSRVPGYRFALTAFFLSGFTAMVYEIAWSWLLLEVIGSEQDLPKRA